MIGERKMEGQEVEDGNTNVKVTLKTEISPDEVNNLIEFYKAGYKERWISDDHFREVVMSNTSQVVRLYEGDDLAAACNINTKRVTDIAVHPNYQGRGLGAKLLKEVAKVEPEAWVTIGVDAEAMLATVTDPSLSFLPVEDKERIEGLYREIHGVDENFTVETKEAEAPLLAERLVKKGIDHSDSFTAFYRPNSLHKSIYYQILFQNQPTTT